MEREKRKAGLWIGILILAVSFAVGGIFPCASAQVVNIRIGHTAVVGHPYDLGAKKFKELMEARLPGKVKVEIFPAAVLGGERDMVEGTKLGTVEMSIAAADVVSAMVDVKELFILLMPFMFSSYDQFGKVMEGPVGDEFNELLRKKGIRNVGWMTAGFHHLINRVRPIYTPEDLKGIKMRMWESKGAILGLKAMGATAVPMAFPEVYTGLQQGVIEGLSNSFTTFYLQKFYEVAQYISITYHFIITMSFEMGEDFFQKLPPDVKKAVLECGKEASRYQRGLYVDADKRDFEMLKKSQKVKFNDAKRDLFIKQVAPFRKDFADLIGGPGAKEYVEKVFKEVNKYK